MLFSVLVIIGVKFFPAQDQTDVIQPDPVFACTHCNLDYNHTRNRKTKLLALVKQNKKNKNSKVISNCLVVNINTKLVPDNDAKNLIGRKRDM